MADADADAGWRRTGIAGMDGARRAAMPRSARTGSRSRIALARKLSVNSSVGGAAAGVILTAPSVTRAHSPPPPRHASAAPRVPLHCPLARLLHRIARLTVEVGHELRAAWRL